MLSRAGIDTNTFNAHSVMRASASSALNKGISLEEILLLAHWSADSTFYYTAHFITQP